jgi:hypothetical protein
MQRGRAAPLNQQINELLATFKEIEGDLEALIAETVGDVAKSIEKRAVKSIRRKTIGRKYGEHTAGAKGEAPNTKDGDLMRSLRTDHTKGEQTAYVGSDLEESMALEVLYKHPFLRPAMRKGKNDFKRKIRVNLKAAIARHRE